MKPLHADFLTRTEIYSPNPLLDLTDFNERYLDAATSVPRDVLAFWLNDSRRECLTAAWILALSPDALLRDRKTELLLESKTCYQGQGLCIATARYRDQQAANDLKTYLRTNLPVRDRQYDQEWAIGCLAWFDRCLGTNDAEPFIHSTENWNLVVAERVLGVLLPNDGIEIVANVMAFLDDLAIGMSGRLSYRMRTVRTADPTAALCVRSDYVVTPFQGWMRVVDANPGLHSTASRSSLALG